MMEFLETIRDFLSDVMYALGQLADRVRTGITGFIKNRIKKKTGVSGFRIRDLNVYRRVRESLVYCYLKRTVTFTKTESIITWQPLLFVLFKVAGAGILSYLFFSLYPYVSGYLKEVILFFRLHEIYNFDFPTTTFLDNMAKIILGIVIGYTGLFFVKYQAEALLSACVISLKNKKIYYIKNTFLIKHLYIISIPEIDHVVLKQNILTRVLGIGTLLLQKKSGEQIIIASIKNPSHVVSALTAVIGPGPDKGTGV